MYHPPCPPLLALSMENAPHSVLVFVLHMADIVLIPVIVAPFTFQDHLTNLVTMALVNHDTLVPSTDTNVPITDGSIAGIVHVV